MELQVWECEEALLETADAQLLRKLTDAGRRSLLDRMQEMEFEGCDLRAAGGTLELLIRESLDPEFRPFEPLHFEVTSHSTGDHAAISIATASVRIGDFVRSETEEGDGPVNALERSLRQCLFATYPEIGEVEIKNYRVDVLENASGTCPRARVLMEWREADGFWTTVGESRDLTAAAWLALVDGFRLLLMRRGRSQCALSPLPADSSWAV